MATSIHRTPSSKDQSHAPVVQIIYECIIHRRLRESDSYVYELACSITYPVASAYLSLRINGKNTFQNRATKEVPFLSHENGATTYVELQEGEQLEVRVVEHEGTYCKASYAAHGQTLAELNARHVVSSLQRIAAPTGAQQNGTES